MKDQPQQAARGVLETLPAVMRALASEMRRCEHPMPMPHFGTLMILSKNGFTLSELAERQRVSLPTMSNTVSILVNNGWAERVADEDDRRKMDVLITPAGLEALQEMVLLAENAIADRLSSLTEEELSLVSEGLALLRRAFGGPHDGAAAPAGSPE
jgi:DNA-binding MarR family transcriptional regulator